MPRQTVRLDAPRDFNLRSTVRSHGWSDLPPFEADRKGDRLSLRLGWATATVRQKGREVTAELGSDRPLTEAQRRRAVKILASCLRFDLDLSEFWALCLNDPELAWAARRRAGRFLRAPTVFGNAVMILATTNCSWALTRRIVRSLVDRWGENGALPAKERLAEVSEAEFRRHASLGYRAPYLAALARGPDLEDLLRDETSTPQLRRQLLQLPGFGPYAAENLLRILGRFEHLALDSWVVAAWKRLHPRRKTTETAIARHLRRYGEWKGLALWLLVTARWYGPETWRDKF